MNLGTRAIAHAIEPEFDAFSENVQSEILGQVYRIECGHAPKTKYELLAAEHLKPAPLPAPAPAPQTKGGVPSMNAPKTKSTPKGK